MAKLLRTATDQDLLFRELDLAKGDVTTFLM